MIRLALVLGVLLPAAACVVGEDQSNCVTTACHGCCGIGGRCENGITDRACGTAALACVDCTLRGMKCDAASRSCVTPCPGGACAAGRCNTCNGSATPCCPTAQPCQLGTQCYPRASAPAGSQCCP